MSEMKVNEKKVVRRSVAIALGIICIILIAFVAYFSITGISAQNSYNNLQDQNQQLQSWLDGNITYYNSQISSLNSQIANLQNQLNSLMNGTRTSLDIVVTRSSEWVNKTVVVQGFLNKLDYGVYLPWQIPPPWNYLLVSSNYFDQIGILWNGAAPNSSQVQIHGVVRQGLVNLNGTDITVFYIEAETVNPI